MRFISNLGKIIAIAITLINGILTRKYEKNINKLNLLLPIFKDAGSNENNNQISFTLEAYNGCYEWSSSHPHFLSIEQISDPKTTKGCFNKARVIVKSKKETNTIIWITATDKETGDVLKCESKVAEIRKLQIITKMRTIDVGDYETFELIGYDSKGNAFTTLEGLKFDWSIDQDQKLATYVSFRESSILTSQRRSQLENEGWQSDIVVMKGLKTGWVEVNSRINEEGYGHITSSVKILIVEHFLLYPEADLFVLPLSSIHFDLFSVKISNSGAKYSKIGLPSDNYKWTLNNPSVGDLTLKGVLNCNRELGSTGVLIEDKRGSDNQVENTVTVVEPWNINMLVRECMTDFCKEKKLPKFLRKNKADFKFTSHFDLIYGKRYVIKAFVYDKLNNKVTLTENVELKWDLPNELKIIEVRGDEVLVEANTLFDSKIGTSGLNSVRYGSRVYDIQNDISVTKDISVHLPVKIIRPSSVIRLPLTGQSHLQTIKLYSVGGSSSYDWYSTESQVAVVSLDGVITAKGEGETKIIVADKSNPDNIDEIKVIVTEIGGVHFVEELKEVVVSQESDSLVYMTDVEGKRFTNCNAVEFNLDDEHSNIGKTTQKVYDGLELNQQIAKEIEDDELFRQVLTQNGKYTHDSVLSSHFYTKYLSNGNERGKISQKKLNWIFSSYRNFGICGAVTTTSLNEGDNTLKLSIGNLRTAVQLQKFFTIIETTSPLTDRAYFLADEYLLTHHSSMKWGIKGGPRKWEDVQKNLISSFSTGIENKKSLKYYTIEQSYNTRKIFVLCNNENSPAESIELTLTLSNERCSRLIKPVLMKKSIKVKCGNPKNLKIFKIGKNQSYLTTGSFKSYTGSSNNLITDTPYKLQVWAFDEYLKPYFNFSSLEFQWTGADISHGISLTNTDINTDFKWYGDEYRTLTLDASTLENKRNLEIKIKCENFEGKQSPGTFKEIEDTITFKILDSISLLPQTKILLLHPAIEGQVKILGGSGTFNIKLNDTTIVDFDYNENLRLLTFTPKSKGAVLITVSDLSQEVVVRTQGIIRVTGPHRIKLKLDKDLVESGSKIKARVQVFDSEGNQFEEEQLKLVHFNLEADYNNFPKDSKFSTDIIQRDHNEFDIVTDLEKSGLENVPLTAQAKGQFDPINQNKDFTLLTKGSFMVYSKIESFPAKISSSPGCTFTVNILFGKLKHDKYSFYLNFQTGDSEMLKIIKQGENFITFEALQSGKTSVTAQLIERSSNKILTSVKVPIGVNVVTGVRILKSQNRRVHVNAPIRMIASPMIGNDIMTPSFCKFEYKWETSYTNVIEISSAEVVKTYDDSKTTLFNTHIALNVTGLKPGTAEVSLKLLPKYPGNLYAKNNEVSSTTTVRFIEAINSRFNVYLGKKYQDLQSEILILPRNAGYKLIANRDIYNLDISSPCDSSRNLMNIEENGFITTYDINGLTTIKLTDKSEPENFRLVNLQITDIYALITENSYKASLVSQGGKVNLKLTLQDEFGRVFPAPLYNYDFTVISTISSIVSLDIDNETHQLTIRGLNKGETLVYVHLTQNPKIFDVFKVTVGSLVTPASPVKVHVGGSIKFRVGGEVKKSMSKVWKNLDKDILKIEPYSGESQALETGKDVVIYDDGVHVETKVEVFQIDNIRIEHPTNKKLTNIPENNIEFKEEKEKNFLEDNESNKQVIQHKIGVSFYEGVDQIFRLFHKNSPEIENGLKAECRVNEPQWFDVELSVNSDKGSGFENTFCILRPKSSYPQVGDFPQEVVLTVELHSTHNDFSISESATIEYDWGFKFSDATVGKITENVLDLTQDRPGDIITIFTPRELNFDTSGKFPSTFISSSYDAKRKIQILKIKVPEKNLYGNFNGSLVLEDRVSMMKKELVLEFKPESSYYKGNGIHAKKSKSIGLMDVMLVLSCILVVYFSFSVFRNKNKENEEELREFRRGSFHGASFSRMR